MAIYDNMPRINVTKAVKGRSTIDKIQAVLGGDVFESPSTNAKHQDQLVWVLRSDKAARVIARLIPFIQLKRLQCQAIDAFPRGKYNVLAKKGDDEQVFQSRPVLSKMLGVSAQTVYCKLKKGQGVCEIKGWCLQDRTKGRDALAQKVRRLKQIPHEPVTGMLHPAYTAGFFDAEGYVGFWKEFTIRVALSQKYSPVLDAIQRLYGGRVSMKGGQFQWRLAGTGSMAFLTVILPFLVEKREQVQIALLATGNTYREKEAEMRRLRGRQL